MKLNYLIKATPFISTLLLIIILNIGNQKEYAKLRIFIWDTPSQTLGTYLSISAGLGFIFSYLTTTSLAKLVNTTPRQTLKYRDDNRHEEIINEFDTSTNIYHENTLIERDIKDPSPTINANFRVIGRRGRSNTNYIKEDNLNVNVNDSKDFEEQYDYQPENTQTFKEGDHISNDWHDDSYSRW